MLKKLLISSCLLICFAFSHTVSAEGDTRPAHFSAKDFDGMAIIVASFDKYEPLWEPFFHFLKKSWPSLYEENKNIPIYLLSQTKVYKDQRVQMKLNPQEKSWSHSMIKALSSIKEPYVLFLLDDYLINVPVQEERLSAIYQETKRLGAANIQLQWVNPDQIGPRVGYIRDLVQTPKHAAYRTSLQSGIWHRETFIHLLKEEESAWDFETKGSRRSEGNMAPFLKLAKDPPLDFLNAMYRGCLREEVEAAVKAEGLPFNHDFRRYNDFSQRLKRWYNDSTKAFKSLFR